jgi:PAS domain S-box-containing protein
LLSFTLGVAALDWISLMLMQHDNHVATLWPAKGLVVAFCLLRGRAPIAPILLAGVVGGVLGKLIAGDTLFCAAGGTAISIAGTALTAQVAIRFLGGDVDFRDWKKLAGFIAIACTITALTAPLGAEFSTFARGGEYHESWISWSLSTALTYIIFAPTIVLAATRSQTDQSLPNKNLKIAMSLLCTLAVLIATTADLNFPIVYLVPIALLITSLVAEMEGAAWALLLTAVFSLCVTAMGWGPATLVKGTIAFHVVLVQLFLVAMTIGVLPAAAVTTERRKLNHRLALALEETQNAAASLTNSEERYRLLAETSTDLIVQVNRQGKIVYVSPASRVLGYTPEELIGTQGCLLAHPDDRPSLAANDKALLTGAAECTGWDREHRFRSKSGEWIWMQGNPAVLRDAQGKPDGYMNILRDVTERKAIDAELVAARKRAEAAAEVKSEFLANMSHELRTPLTSVIGFADLLHDTCNLDDQSRRYVSRVRTASRALLSTINDILDFSKLESRQIELAPERVDLHHLGQEVVELFAAQAASKGIGLEFGSSPELESARILIDPQRLRQVLLNLVGNAVKFTENGSVALRIAFASDGRGLRFDVEDSGPGIPSDRMDRLFQRFSQVDRSTSRAHGGTGLGLAICKGLVETMGGRIGVSTEWGRGSVFWFELPLGPGHVAPQEQLTAPTSNGTQRARVLVVDDNDANRALVRAILGSLNVDVVEAHCGPAAIDFAANHSFDLILMDLQMPGMTGTDAMRAIRELAAESSGASIVAFTADGDAARLATLRNAGFDGVLSKPIVIADLAACIDNVVSAKTAAAGSHSRRVA